MFFLPAQERRGGEEGGEGRRRGGEEWGYSLLYYFHSASLSFLSVFRWFPLLPSCPSCFRYGIGLEVRCEIHEEKKSTCMQQEKLDVADSQKSGALTFRSTKNIYRPDSYCRVQKQMRKGAIGSGLWGMYDTTCKCTALLLCVCTCMYSMYHLPRHYSTREE